LYCKPVGGKADLGDLGDRRPPLGSRGESPPEAEKFLLNLITILTFPGITIQYNTIQYKTYNAPYVTKMLFVGAGMTRD